MSEICMAITGNMSRFKILVVDDDPAIGSLITDLLQQEGYEPIYFKNPLNALEFSEKNSFDLAFLDINMPEMSGIELSVQLKDINTEGEIVFITGFGSFDNAIQAIKVGACDFLRKPFSVSEIQLCIRRFKERWDLKEKVRLAESRYFDLV
jgi:two-component system, NtrC family, sensor histidine kinase HydH